MLLSFDPSLASSGWALLDDEQRIIAYGQIPIPSRVSLPKRLKGVSDHIKKEILPLVGENPVTIVLEDSFAKNNMLTFKRLAQSAGVILATLADLDYRGPYLLAPATIKATVAGHGFAEKQQFVDAVNACFGLSLTLAENDIADAIGAALTYRLKPEKAYTYEGDDPNGNPKKKRKARSKHRRTDVLPGTGDSGADAPTPRRTRRNGGRAKASGTTQGKEAKAKEEGR